MVVDERKTGRSKSSNDDEADTRLDAIAAVAVLLIAVTAFIFFLSKL